MAEKDLTFVTAICKSKEKRLLGEERLKRMIESPNAEEAMKILKEVNFGGETSVGGAYDFEKLIEFEEEGLTAFIREYSPNNGFLSYCLSDNDFHNAECAVRLKYIRSDARLFTAYGNIKADDLKKAAEEQNYDGLPEEMAIAMKTAAGLFESEEATGLNISTLFINAKYKYLLRVCKSRILNEFIVFKIDMLNVSTALRARDIKSFDKMKIDGGTISDKDFGALCDDEPSTVIEKFKTGAYGDFIRLAAEALVAKKPMTAFENAVDSFMLKKLKETRFDNVGIEPVLLYFCYRKNELRNVRIIMVGLMSGESKQGITERLRENYAG